MKNSIITIFMLLIMNFLKAQGLRPFTQKNTSLLTKNCECKLPNNYIQIGRVFTENGQSHLNIQRHMCVPVEEKTCVFQVSSPIIDNCIKIVWNLKTNNQPLGVKLVCTDNSCNSIMVDSKVFKENSKYNLEAKFICNEEEIKVLNLEFSTLKAPSKGFTTSISGNSVSFFGTSIIGDHNWILYEDLQKNGNPSKYITSGVEWINPNSGYANWSIRPSIQYELPSDFKNRQYLLYHNVWTSDGVSGYCQSGIEKSILNFDESLPRNIQKKQIMNNNEIPKKLMDFNPSTKIK